MHITLLVASYILVPLGIFMAIVPALPALSYMFVIALLFALTDGFVSLSGKELIMLLVFVIISLVTDTLSGILGAKYGGAHSKSLLWGILGSILGTFSFPPFGGLVGLFAAILLSELYYKKPKDKAIKAASGALLGTAIGIAINVFLAIAFTATFIFFTLN